MASGKTFLQDIADVDRTDLNDEYLENMATFLQSIDENSDAYDGIVITDEIREALADSNIDLRTASEEDVQQLVEQLGKSYVSEDAAMDHVEDMLVEHTDLKHDEFEEHVDDSLADTEQALRSDQKKDSQVTAVSATGFDAAAAGSATEQVRVDEPSDLSLNIPSLELPGEEQAETLTTETEGAAPEKQEEPLQDKIAVPVANNESDIQNTDILAGDDLSHALPSESLSNLFDEQTEDIEITPSSGDETQQQKTVAAQVEEPAIEAETVNSNTAPAAKAESIADDTASIVDDTTEASEQQEIDNESNLNTDDLHINLDEETDTSDLSESEAEINPEEAENNLDRFSANTNNSEEKESSSLDEFSANNATEDDKEMDALDTIDDTTDTEDSDQLEDAGLSDEDAIIEDIPQEPEQVDASCAG